MAFEFWRRLFAGDPKRVSVEEISEDELFGLSAELYVRELAFWSCVNIVGNALSKCEFKTFVNGAETKGPEWYAWNVSPNLNQNSSGLLHRLVAQLFRNNEALVIEERGNLLVADSYSRKPYALYEDVFSQVQVGDFTFERSFVQSEVLFIQLAERDMRVLVNGFYETYRKLLDYSMRSYQKSRGTKGVLELDTMAAGDAKFQETYDDIKNRRFRTFAEAENAVLPLWKGMKYSDLGSKTYSNEGTRDIRAMINDVSDLTAKAFGIPPALLSGEVQGTADAMDQFLTFCIDPLCDMLQEEINRKRSGMAGVLAGTYVRIDTKCIKHVDLLSVATAIDKLISSGAFCVNDIRELVGEAPLDEPWAKKHFVTKNYETIEEALLSLQAENEDTEDGAQAPPTGEKTVSEVSLNGAQVASLLQIVQSVISGVLGYESA